MTRAEIAGLDAGTDVLVRMQLVARLDSLQYVGGIDAVEVASLPPAPRRTIRVAITDVAAITDGAADQGSNSGAAMIAALGRTAAALRALAAETDATIAALRAQTDPATGKTP
ncbi:hypothetical protein [Blastochloris tepida]|uniref:Uncharacterized protein n=1 Tax=Blastochloris tepida TaxID=2233851 RepID=A0A348G1B4_9HYPH|nr:hypothetical protein [Blastochloris tepida]BBF93347.1 hypothetical protein BLTE_20320 [Blastochloris tepida]